jgi:hypothetical protein
MADFGGYDGSFATEVVPTPFTQTEKRALGDYLLLVIQRAIQYIIQNIKGKVPNHLLSALSTDGHLKEILDNYYTTSTKEFANFLPKVDVGQDSGLHEFLDNITHNVWIHTGNQSTNVHTLLVLLHDLCLFFELPTELWSLEDIQNLHTHLLRERMSTQFGIVPKNYNPRVHVRPYIGQSEWVSSQRHDASEDWDTLQFIFNILCHLPAKDVLVPALGDVLDQYDSETIPQLHRTATHAQQAEFQELFFNTLLFHPVAVQFWSSVFHVQGYESTSEAFDLMLRELGEGTDDASKNRLRNAIGIFQMIFSPHGRSDSINPTHVDHITHGSIPSNYRGYYSNRLALPEARRTR